MLNERSILTIEGKVKQKIVKKLTHDFSLNENQLWFFVDYAAEDVALHSKFDVLLEGKSQKLVLGPGRFSLKLLACLDQFGNKLSSVPRGWKTICKLESHPNIPTSLKKLPFLEEWDYNPNAISLVNSKNVELAVPDGIIQDLYKIVFIHIRNSFDQKPKRPLYKKDLIDFLKKSFKTHSSSANQILETLMQLGKVTQKSDNEVELADLEE